MINRTGKTVVLIAILIFSSTVVYAFSLQETMIKDNLGRTVQVKKPFKKIISLYGAHTENLFFIGAESSLFGVTKTDSYPEEAKEKKVFSYHDDPEKFLAYMPDLVLIRPMIDRGYPGLIRRLEKTGITVVSIQPSSISEMYEYWKILGLLTGKQEAATHMIETFKEKVRAFEKLSKTIPTKKRVYFESIHTKMKTFTPDSMAIFVLEAAGGQNVAADALQVRNTNIAMYGKERILSKADDIDVFLAQTGIMNQPDRYMIQNEPGFRLIKAVKTNQIFFIDEMIVSRPTYRLLNGIYQTGLVLYPDVFLTQGATILNNG